MFKFSPEGKLLLTLGKAGVVEGRAPTRFCGPSACRDRAGRQHPDRRRSLAAPDQGPQDGDRLVWFTRDGKFIKEFGRHGRKPGEFMGPHALAFDSQGRLFVADRSNNRDSDFDKDMKFVD